MSVPWKIGEPTKVLFDTKKFLPSKKIRVDFPPDSPRFVMIFMPGPPYILTTFMSFFDKSFVYTIEVVWELEENDALQLWTESTMLVTQ